MGGGGVAPAPSSINGISVFSVEECRTKHGSLTTDGVSTSDTSEISVNSGKSSFLVKVLSRAKAFGGGGGRGLLGIEGGGGGKSCGESRPLFASK